MFGLFFTSDAPVRRYEQVMACDVARFRRFFHLMLDAGVYLAPSAFEAGFISAAHGDAEIEATVEAAARAFESDRQRRLMRAALWFLAAILGHAAAGGAARLARLAGRARAAAGMAVPQGRQPLLAVVAARRTRARRAPAGTAGPRGLGLWPAASSLHAPRCCAGLAHRARDDAADDARDAGPRPDGAARPISARPCCSRASRPAP